MFPWTQGFIASTQGLCSLLRHREQRCVVCLDPFVTPKKTLDVPVCATCYASLQPRMAGYCSLCGEPAANPHAPCTPCGNCIKNPPPWNWLRFYGIYEGLLRKLILAGKFHNDDTALHLLGLLLMQRCEGLPQVDAIVPVPLHPHRLRQRGSNQCTELARPLARTLQCPLDNTLLSRTIHTEHQIGLRQKQRISNLRHAFTASPLCDKKRILLIDDTMTTGTTLRQCATTLLKAGACDVSVLVVARASRHVHLP